jgi:hypothetical protein
MMTLDYRIFNIIASVYACVKNGDNEVVRFKKELAKIWLVV